jgi:uncharacterized protein YbbC (DUF1343 family)/Na+/proline symporter
LASGDVSWFTAMLSIVATETSVLTFISVPGISYRGDWSFLQLALGYIAGRILVSIFLLPIFFKHGITSIYEILEKKFNVYIQKLASFTFLITRILADGVRFLATAIIIQSITGWSIYESILLIGIITLIYTVSGGLKAVIHIDAFQFIIYLLSAMICIYFIIDLIPENSINYLYNNGKFKIFNFTNDIITNPFSFFSAFIGGCMLSFASHGSDYMMVQRVLATSNIASARKAMIGSGFFVFIQFSLFLFIGSLIYIVSDCMMIEKDREITYIINEILPVGFKGIVIVGVLSAAMSTLSSSINALSSSTLRDWLPHINSLKISRIVVFIWTIILMVFAIIFNNVNSSLIIIGLKIASFTYGVLLSFFILAKFGKFKTENIVLGYLSGILVVFVFSKMGIAWTFYILGSVFVNVLTVLLLERAHKFLFVRDIVITLIISITISLFFKKNEDTFTSDIIDISVKDSCLEKKVFNGSDILLYNEKYFNNISNIGLVVNHSSNIIEINEQNNTIVPKFKNFNLKIIFTPEHGLVNNYAAGEYIEDITNFNIPIVSLYGDNLKPHSKYLENLDAIIFDIQDIGSRYYTYVSTMTNIMEICALNNIPFYVLDRPNPISGKVEGPILDKAFSSFVGMHQIPIRHGMTIGEIALMINENDWLENELKSDLHIVKMQGWNRSMYFNDTNLIWVPPSPNIPNIQSAILYSGLCLFEGTNISEGRGTETPFEIIGSPWLNSEKIIEEIKYKNLEGVKVSKINFVPKSIKGKSLHPKYLNEQCNGIKITILDRKKINPIELALNLISIINKIHPEEFDFLEGDFIDKLYGSNDLRNHIVSNEDINVLINSWVKFNNEKYLLY